MREPDDSENRESKNRVNGNKATYLRKLKIGNRSVISYFKRIWNTCEYI